MSEKSTEFNIKDHMRPVVTGPRADRRQINLVFNDIATKYHPDQSVVREGHMASLIDWLNEGYVYDPVSPTSPEEQLRIHRESRVRNDFTKLDTDHTFYVEMEEDRSKLFQLLVESGSDLVAFQQLASIVFDQYEIPNNLRFMLYSIYVRVGNTTKFITHKTRDTNTL